MESILGGGPLEQEEDLDLETVAQKWYAAAKAGKPEPLAPPMDKKVKSLLVKKKIAPAKEVNQLMAQARGKVDEAAQLPAAPARAMYPKMDA